MILRANEERFLEETMNEAFTHKIDNAEDESASDGYGIKTAYGSASGIAYGCQSFT